MFSESHLLVDICLVEAYWIQCTGEGDARWGLLGFVGWDLLDWLGRFRFWSDFLPWDLLGPVCKGSIDKYR